MFRFTKKIASIIVSVTLAATMILSASASESYKTWIQSDSSWGNKTLGSCSDTMSEIGCAVTSIAILAVHSQSVSENVFNPGVLCDYLSNNGGFDNYGNLYWGAITGLVPDFTFKKRANLSSDTETGITQELSEYINQGYYVVLSVNYDGHWIAIDTVKDGEIYMIDPAQNKETNLFDYYDAETMLQVRLYKGKVTPDKIDGSSVSKTFLTGHYKLTSTVNLRESYDTSSSILSVVPKGKTVVVTRVNNNGWGQIEYDGKTGWICLDYASYIEDEYSYKTGEYKVNESGGVYLRRGIGTQSTSTCLVPYNGKLTIDMVTANWGRAKYNDSTGWVCMEYVTYIGETPATTTTAVTTPAQTTTTKTTTTVVQTTDNSPLIKGDVNRDGAFSKTDLILLNDYIALPYDVKFEERYVMDVNDDKVIDERDSVYLLKIINKGN